MQEAISARRGNKVPSRLIKSLLNSEMTLRHRGIPSPRSHIFSPAWSHRRPIPAIDAPSRILRRLVLRIFFDADDYEEVTVNRGITQRIILIAANFRKEVTSTVL